jgi:carotenoid cleavage dioxygenase
MERLQSGGPAFAWEPDRGTHIALVSRKSGALDARWFEGDPCYAFHFLNAFDARDGRVIVDAMKSPFAALFPWADGTPPRDAVATLVRWSLDPDSPRSGWREEPLDDRPGEFPRLDERFASLSYCHGYFRADSRDTGGGTGIAHVDLRTRRVAEWQPGQGDHCDEPVFVPRSSESPEGDGWLLTTVYRAAKNCSDLAVIDARDVAAGPIALVHLSHRIPAGFHGSWLDGPL